MSSVLVVEILLGVLAAAVGWAGYQGSKSANSQQAVSLPVNVEADAYERAKNIYEGAIGSLQDQLDQLRGEVIRLRESNTELLVQIEDLKFHNRQLVAELREQRGTA